MVRLDLRIKELENSLRNGLLTRIEAVDNLIANNRAKLLNEPYLLGNISKDDELKYVEIYTADELLPMFQYIIDYGKDDDIFKKGSETCNYKLITNFNTNNIITLFRFFIANIDFIPNNYKLFHYKNTIEYIDRIEKLINSIFETYIDVDTMSYIGMDNFTDVGTLDSLSRPNSSMFHIDSTIEISTEAVDVNDTDVNYDNKIETKLLANIKTVGNVVMNIRNSISKMSLNVKHFLDKFNIARSMFYNKNMMKIDSLYQHYASSAMVVENELNGDPVDILINKCGPYIEGLVDGTIEIYTQFNNLFSSLSNMNSYSEYIDHINNFITYEKSKLDHTMEPKVVATLLQKDIRFKVGQLILKDNTIYGINIEYIVNNKYPDLQHAILSLFIPKPHEKPIEQNVSSIISSAESFKLMSKELKLVILKNASVVNNKLQKVSLDKDYHNYIGTIKQNKNKLNTIYSEKMNTMKTNKIDGGIKKVGTDDAGVDKAFTKDIQNRKKLLNNFGLLFDTFMPIFMYTAETGEIMYNVSMTVDKTVRDCLQAMLNKEAEASDNGQYRYDTSGNHKATSYDKFVHNNELSEKGMDSKQQAYNDARDMRRGYKPISVSDDRKLYFR